MDRRTIGAIWIGGIVLMAALYVIGPQDFIRACQEFLGQFWSFVSQLIDTLMQRAFDAVRAAAIALYVVFVVLALLAGHRGIRSGGALFVVTVLFALLLGTGWYSPGTGWFSAALVACIGALVMTGRLLRAPSMQRDPRDPWGVRPPPVP
jgi:hypothetical protein